MINEAVFLLQEGGSTKEAIDTAMTIGANHPLGPLALADLIGLDTCLAIMTVLHRESGDSKYRPATRMLASASRRSPLSSQASLADSELMEWTPLPEAASMCQGGSVGQPLNREGRQNEDYDNWH